MEPHSDVIREVLSVLLSNSPEKDIHVKRKKRYPVSTHRKVSIHSSADNAKQLLPQLPRSSNKVKYFLLSNSLGSFLRC